MILLERKSTVKRVDKVWKKFSCLFLRTELQERNRSLLLLQTLIKGMEGLFPDTEVVLFKTSPKFGDLAQNWGLLPVFLTGMSGSTGL